MPIRKLLVPLSGQYDSDDPEPLERPARETAFLRGRVLLERVEEAGADMLGMWAYTRDRVRRLIFRRVTGEVLASMRVPVLMVD